MNVQPSNPNNPIVFFDVTVGGQVGGFCQQCVQLAELANIASLLNGK